VMTALPALQETPAPPDLAAELRLIAVV